MYTISIKGHGVDPLLVGLSRLLRLTDDLSTAWPSVTAELRQIMAEQFTSEGGAGGNLGKWKPLSEAYAEWKRRKFPGRTILELTGALRASLQVETADSVVVGTPKSLYFGTSVVNEKGVHYPIFHQLGQGVPRRPIFSFSNRQTARIGSVLHKWLGREMAKAGARAA